MAYILSVELPAKPSKHPYRTVGTQLILIHISLFPRAPVCAVSSTQFKCCIVAMTKPGYTYYKKQTGEQVKMRGNLTHWGSWDTVDMCAFNNLLWI